MCGLVLQRVEVEPDPAHAPAVPIVHRRAPACEPHRTTLAYLGIGLALAPLFLLPLLDFTGWFLASLIHETGHCAFAWLAGCPSFPAISLAGHAMAQHHRQSVALCLVFWCAIAWLAWRHRDKAWGLWGLGGLALLYPVFAFTGLREAVFLLGGHVGELVFATIFFWRAFITGFARSTAERIAYSTAAWFLLGRNLWLSGGLIFDEGVRSWYRSSGSFGLTNDYIRLAQNVLKVDLGVVAGFMLLVSLTVLPVAWILSRPVRRGDFR
jgi:hypothetical protein